MLTFLEISANFQIVWRWPCVIVLSLASLSTQVSMYTTALDIHYSRFSCQKKLTWVLGQSRSFKNLSKWCSKQSRSSFSQVLGKFSFNSKLYGGCVCDNWEPGFLPRLIFNWRTFLRRVTVRWPREWAKDQVSSNQNSRNRWCQITRGTICILNLHAKNTCKNHTASPESSLHLLLTNTWFGYW